MSILQIIEQVAATPKRTEKEAILKANADNELLQAVFKAAYDPTINYFIKKIPAYTCQKFSDEATLGWALQTLTILSNRTLTGNDAIDHLQHTLESIDGDDAEIISRIIQRDLKCGATDSTANKVWKGLIPEFPYMRCSLVKEVKLDKWDWVNGIYSQIKADAMFANCDIMPDGTILFTSRNGTELPSEKLTKLCVEILESYPRGNRLHGEIMVERDGLLLPREISNGLINKLVKGDYTLAENERAVYYIWDYIPLVNAVPDGKCNIPYEERFGSLQRASASACLMGTQNYVRLIETRIVYSIEEAYEHYFEVIEKGLEGTIIKTKSGKWADHTSRDQVKLKVECDVDLEIEGFNPGTGKNAHMFGSIRCKTSDGLLRVNVTGFPDKLRAEIDAMKDTLEKAIMTVKFNNLMKPTEAKSTWSLFLPRHVEIRRDKTEADSLQRVIDQFESLIKPKR